jgi:hypothetical protein
MMKKADGGSDFSRAGIRNGGRQILKRKIQSLHQDPKFFSGEFGSSVYIR